MYAVYLLVMNIVVYLTPTNLAQEEEKFFSSSNYNPQLTYAWHTPEARAWLDEQTDAKKLLSALRSRAYAQATWQACKYFETDIVPSVLARANKELENPITVAPTPPIEKIANAFTAGFAQLGLDEYQLEVADERGYNFRPQQHQKRLRMSKYAQLGYLSLEGEVRHELVHLIRTENGLHNGIPVSAQYLPTEEGLATYCQDWATSEYQTSSYQHAAEYAATAVMMQGSLRDGYTFLRDRGFSAKLAWQRAIRHKFGWTDTSQPGDLMKPAMYYSQQLRVGALSVSDRYRLFVGKIALDELKKYLEYSGRVPLERLQEYYPFSN